MSKNWYQHKMETGFTHRGNPVQKGQKVWLTDKQAEGGNSTKFLGFILEDE